MTWSLTVNGTDLATWGFYPVEGEGVFGVADRTILTAPVFGRAGTLISGSVEGARVLTVTGTLTSTAKTIAGLETNADAFKDLLRGGEVRLVRDNGSTAARSITGWVGKIDVRPIGHPLAPTDSRVTFTVTCRDAYWGAVEPTSRVLGTTRKTVELGTAPSTGIIRIITGTNPVLTYRDAAGTAQKTMTFTVTLAATNDWLEIDMRRGTITKSLTGVQSNGLSLLTSGDFPWAFDPHDGDPSTAAYPTLELSTGTGIAYWWKAYP